MCTLKLCNPIRWFYFRHHLNLLALDLCFQDMIVVFSVLVVDDEHHILNQHCILYFSLYRKSQTKIMMIASDNEQVLQWQGWKCSWTQAATCTLHTSSQYHFWNVHKICTDVCVLSKFCINEFIYIQSDHQESQS